jgi:lantibiotic modifying enzyme
MQDAAREALRRDGALLGHGWCRGTAGRLAVELELASGSGGHDAARRLVDATSTPRTPRLGFCCGVAGQVDVLVLAAERLDEPALARAARRSALAARPRIEGLLRNESLQPFDPGLFTGWAGIGYALLRLLRPEDVPSLAVLS